MITSESVGAGHPDKVCDQISDAILDAYLKQDPHAKTAIECLITHQRLLIAGEVNSTATVDPVKIAKEVLEHIGYNNIDYGFDHATAHIESTVHQQSPDIARGVIKQEATQQGAGDQGLMYGYATKETEQRLPLSLVLTHTMMKKAHELSKQHSFLGPDAKCQVSIAFDEGTPKIHNVVFSQQHTKDKSLEDIRTFIHEEIIKPVCGQWLTANTQFHLNPSGEFIQGGPYADTGLTGRKIIVDTYGGLARHGGGAFSGKDPSKVDRSAAYMARYIAKNVVEAGFAERCEIQLCYAIGKAEPTAMHVETFGTNTIPNEQIIAAIEKTFDCTPYGIVTTLDLLKPQYQQTATFGHFGYEYPWEKTDKVQELQNAKGI